MKKDKSSKRTGQKSKKNEGSKGTGQKSTGVSRKQFNRMLGVGIGAAGLGAVTGSRAFGSTPKEAVGRDLEGFMRTLLDQPELARRFLENPEAVAAEHGIRLAREDATKIKESAKELPVKAAQPLIKPGGAQGNECDECINIPECDCSGVDLKQKVQPSTEKQAIKPSVKPGGAQGNECDECINIPECDCSGVDLKQRVQPSMEKKAIKPSVKPGIGQANDCDECIDIPECDCSSSMPEQKVQPAIKR